MSSCFRRRQHRKIEPLRLRGWPGVTPAEGAKPSEAPLGKGGNASETDATRRRGVSRG